MLRAGDKLNKCLKKLTYYEKIILFILHSSSFGRFRIM
jgi:hypothetical protein